VHSVQIFNRSRAVLLAFAWFSIGGTLWAWWRDGAFPRLFLPALAEALGSFAEALLQSVRLFVQSSPAQMLDGFLDVIPAGQEIARPRSEAVKSVQALRPAFASGEGARTGSRTVTRSWTFLSGRPWLNTRSFLILTRACGAIHGALRVVGLWPNAVLFRAGVAAAIGRLRTLLPPLLHAIGLVDDIIGNPGQLVGFLGFTVGFELAGFVHQVASVTAKPFRIRAVLGHRRETE
jgi:hypothetical protein